MPVRGEYVQGRRGHPSHNDLVSEERSWDDLDAKEVKGKVRIGT